MVRSLGSSWAAWARIPLLDFLCLSFFICESGMIIVVLA